MNILALDTATETCSVAVLKDQRILADNQLAPRQQTRLILPMIQKILSDADISLSALDAIAFGVGPGSFTGIRLAASVTQGLAFSNDLPVLPISTLQTLAQGVNRRYQHEFVLVALDARMGEIYWGEYQFKKSVMQASSLDRLVNPNDPEILRSDNSLRWIGAGRGFGVYGHLLKSNMNKIDPIQVYPDLFPEAVDMITLARAIINSDPKNNAKTLLSPLDIKPVYLRNQVTHQNQK